jgi:hypothetical protein
MRPLTLQISKLYRNSSLLFAAILVLVFLGFYHTYFRFFPTFAGFPLIMHLHAAAFLLWFVLLIVQPLLIRKKMLAAHRLVGKISYVLVPLIVFTIIGMTRYEYYRDIGTTPRDEELSDFLMSYLDLASFAGYYLVAMLNRKNLSVHVAFIIASSLVLLGPGLGRFMSHLFHSFTVTVVVTYGTIYGVLIGLMIYEKVRAGKPILRSYYLLILCLFITEHLLIFKADHSRVWLWIADKIARYLF